MHLGGHIFFFTSAREAYKKQDLLVILFLLACFWEK